jgi:PAS domain S-box-containing protein
MANGEVRATDPGASPLFLSAKTATRNDRRLPVVVALLSLFIFTAAVPFARLPLPHVAQFIPVYESALIISDLITAVLLFAQFSILRFRALLALASGYLFTALLAFAHLLTFPGVFSPDGMLGAGPQTTAWLYMFWHGAFPLAVIGYALTKPGGHTAAPAGPSPRVELALAVTAVVVAVAALTMLTTAGQSLLPSIMRGDHYAPVMIFVVSTVLVLSVNAVLVLWLRRPHTVLDLWLMVVMCAWTFDVGLSAAFNTGRFDLGFYFGRVYGLLAAAFVLLMLLVETSVLYAQLARSFASEQLRRQRGIEERRLIFDTSVDLILVTDRRGNFVRVSPSSFAILGYRPDEMVGHSAIEFIYADDLDPTRDEMRQARRGKELRNFETRYVHKDGRVVPLAWSGVWSESAQRHFFIGRDMTEHKRMAETERQAKETLAAVINASPVAIVCVGVDRNIVVWSRAAEQIFGYTADEVIGRSHKLVPEGGEAEFNDLIERALAGETIRGVRVQRRRKDGSLADIGFAGAAMYGPNGVTGVACALADISESVKMEQQLLQVQKLDAIGKLTGGVAHDFNNLLTVITSTIDILAEAVADRPELAAIAKLIGEAADRGAELTGHLLSFARKTPLQPRQTDVNGLALESARLLRPTLGENIEIETKFDDAAWPALVDPTQLTTAILNLAVNARDAMPVGGKLMLETANVILDEDYAKANGEVVPGPYVMIGVSDTGEGIPEAIRDKVFEPFFSTKGVGKGTGLGLSMVYGFVKQTGGHIKIYSEIGRGTTIKLYLPQAGERAEEPADGSSELPLSGGSEVILLVEDDPLVRTSVTAEIESLGYETIAVANAAEALAAVDSDLAFDLLFTDVVMSGPMDGRQLADEMAKRRPGTKVLFTSGYTENAITHHGRLDPGVLLLAKPHRKVDLARMLRKALDAVPDIQRTARVAAN